MVDVQLGNHCDAQAQHNIAHTCTYYIWFHYIPLGLSVFIKRLTCFFCREEEKLCSRRNLWNATNPHEPELYLPYVATLLGSRNLLNWHHAAPNGESSIPTSLGSCAPQHRAGSRVPYTKAQFLWEYIDLDEDAWYCLICRRNECFGSFVLNRDVFAWLDQVEWSSHAGVQ